MSGKGIDESTSNTQSLPSRTAVNAERLINVIVNGHGLLKPEVVLTIEAIYSFNWHELYYGQLV